MNDDISARFKRVKVVSKQARKKNKKERCGLRISVFFN